MSFQAETEKKRRTARKENKEKAVKLLLEGKGREAKEYFQRCVDITPEMALDVIKAARDRNIDCIVAPYEADAQLAFLAMSGLANIVVTEDSDLTLFGCQRILFKLIDSGDCVLYERDNLGKVFGLHADSFNFDKFRYMCITAGCDYLASLPGIGLGKSKNFWQKVTNPDLTNVLRKIPAYLKMPQISVTQEYIEKFIKANNTFLYQLVFDPQTRKERPVTPYPDSLKAEVNTMTYCGSYSEPEVALQMALGNMNIFTMKQVDNFDPDLGMTMSNSQPRYGSRSSHRSMWSREFLSKGPNIKKKDDVSKIGFAFEMSGTHGNNTNAEKSSNNGSVSSVVTIKSKGVEKRKIEVTDDQVEEMLMNDNDRPSSPPRKKPKPAEISKFRKLVGLGNEEDSQKNVVNSKYFKKTSISNQILENKDSVTRGRRLSNGDCGTWFKDIEKPSSAEGKFIYRPDKDEPQAEVQVLKEISNSPDPKDDVDERRQRRNPFAVKLKSTVESVSLDVCNKVDEEESSENCSTVTGSLTESSNDSPEAKISSSQLTVYSLDSESLTFSSQDPSPSQPESGDCSSKSPSSSLPSPPPVVKPGPRLGLSKASNGHRNSKNGFNPPRVSGLSSKSNDGKKQISLFEMFGRKTSKAEIGK